jgi:hypothetical protein
MKKIYFLTLFLALSCWASAQYFISEDFSGGTMPPTGWTIDAHAVNWSVENSKNAGGVAPEAQMNYDPSFNGASRLISPVLDMTGFTTATLLFKHFLDDYDNLGGYTIGVATRSGGGAWNIVWSVNPMANVGPEDKEFEISNSDMGASDFQFCIYFNGNSYNMDYWYIDDIMFFVPYNLDASLTKINLYNYCAGPTPVVGEIRNFGNTTINSVDISWKSSDDVIHTTTLDNLNIGFLEYYNYTCTDPFYFPYGPHMLDVWISSVNGTPDDYPDNDLKSMTMNVCSHAVYRKPSFEEFTASTCGPCAVFNTQFNPWTATHEDEITLVKYQMNWPGAGDPYYTAEGGVRRTYYGVTWVPWPQCNGKYLDLSIAAVQAAYDEAITLPGTGMIAASHSLDGTVITVNVNVLPFYDYPDFRVHIIVFENVTTGNVGTNGETQFHHVMMKMMPNANGTQFGFSDREPVTLTETFDLSGTFIEEFDDLGVVVLFQDFATKEIFQSEYSVEDGTYATEASCTSITYDGIPIPDFDPDVLSYDIVLPETTTEMPVVEGTPADPNATVVVVPIWEIPGTVLVDVFGEDLVTRKTYTINFTKLYVGMEDPMPAPKLTVYPNPVNEILYVNGAEGAEISLFSMEGQMVMAISGFTGNSLDVSSLGNGVYTIRIVTKDNQVMNRKFTVLR